MRSVLKVRGIDRLTFPELRALCECADALLIDPDWLACVVSFETGGSFSPSQRNHWADANAKRRGVPYNGAIGLIQFLPATALYLDTSIQALAAMTFVEQMAYVRRYLMTYATRIRSLDDCYLAVFYPNAIGRPDGYVVGRRGAMGFLGRVFEQNAGFDGKGGPKDGDITRGEICSTIRAVRDAAAGVRLDVPDDDEPNFPKAAPLLDMTELARDADDAARSDTPLTWETGKPKA
jgi:hypothetical protein